MTGLVVRQLGLQPYQPVYEQMLAAIEQRSDSSPDELWILQHQPVFTQGQAGKPEHLLYPGDIPVVQTDRGGQVTYHGPGQIVVYLLLDIKRMEIGPRVLVQAIEQALVETLQHWAINSAPRTDAPGVYVEERKIASLGLRIKHGCSFHGLALNVDMDMEPFNRINPCGYSDIRMTQMTAETQQSISIQNVAEVLQQQLRSQLNACGAQYE